MASSSAAGPQRPAAAAPLPLPDIDVTPAERGALRGGAVCVVTGAGGYVASHLVARLLAAGATVRACVRSASSAAHLREIEARYGGGGGGGGGGKLELHEACDLLVPGSFDAAFGGGGGGVRYVFHTASPFQMAGRGEELKRAAMGGTREVLSACARLGGGSLERVVLTSSVAALHAFVAPERAGEGKAPYTAADWNVGSSPSRFPYEHSKAAAERWAWAFVHAASGGEAAVPEGALLAAEGGNADDDAAQTAAALGFGGSSSGDSDGSSSPTKIRWSLSVVNPAFVLGPPLSSREDGESVGAVAKLLQDKMMGAWPDVHFGACDVRDVAKVHALAAVAASSPPLAEKAEGKRLIVAPFRSSFGDVVGAVRRDPDLLPRVRLPRRAAFYPVLLALSPLLAFIGLPAYRLRATYGVPAAAYDCGDAEALIGGASAWTSRDVTVTDMARELLARGLVADASAGRA